MSRWTAVSDYDYAAEYGDHGDLVRDYCSGCGYDRASCICEDCEECHPDADEEETPCP